MDCKSLSLGTWVLSVLLLLTERWRRESPWVVRGSITATSWWMLFLGITDVRMDTKDDGLLPERQFSDRFPGQLGDQEQQMGQDPQDLVPALLLPLVDWGDLQQASTWRQIGQEKLERIRQHSMTLNDELHLNGVNNISRSHWSLYQTTAVFLLQVQEQLHQSLGHCTMHIIGQAWYNIKLVKCFRSMQKNHWSLFTCAVKQVSQ